MEGGSKGGKEDVKMNEDVSPSTNKHHDCNHHVLQTCSEIKFKFKKISEMRMI